MTERVNVLFTLLNFLVLACLVWYLYNRYVVPGVFAKIKEFKQWVDLLAVQQEELEAACEHLQDDISSDQAYASLVEQKFEKWQNFLDRRQDLLYEAYDAICKKAVTTRKVQQEYLHKKQVMNTVLPRVLHQAQTALKEKFKHSAAQQEYMNALLDKMKDS